MTYLHQLDEWLHNVLTNTTADESTVDFTERVQPVIRQKIVESFHNGQRACPNCKPRAPRQQTPAS